MLTIVGQCDQRLFGMKPEQRLARQITNLGELHLVARASAVLSDDTISWLASNPAIAVASPVGTPLAVAVPPNRLDEAKRAISGDPTTIEIRTADAIGEVYVRKLRRTLAPLALDVDEQGKSAVERRLFSSVYKGVTDIVTKYAWPEPAFWLTRGASAVGMSPNFVTIIGFVLTFVAGWQFYIGNIAEGLVAAWVMTLLDTVDGKLARVTVTSSWLGNQLDHGNDLIHPPLWWYCLAEGINVVEPGHPWTWPSCWIILATYVIGRVFERVFKKQFGFNQFMWTRFDSRFRMVVSRRNIILLVMTVGLAAGIPAEAFAFCATWSVLSVLIQGWRYAQAYGQARREPIRAWLG